MNSKTILILTSILVLTFVSCDRILSTLPENEELLDGPIAGLGNEQMHLHNTGDAEFGLMHTQHDGLGPIFNAQSCESCHIGDGRGHPLTTLTRFGRMNGLVFDHMIELGGPQLQDRAVTGYQAEELPPGATGVSRFLPPPVTGLGYLEAIDDSTLMSFADADDNDADGISGVLSLVNAPPFFESGARHIPVSGRFIGRFGRKAGAIDLLHQTSNAYLNDMGLTSDFIMDDVYNMKQGKYSTDNIPDPEVPAARVRSVVFYLRTLKVPPRRNTTSTDVIEGEKLFAAAGCGGCHRATITTGPSDISALNYVVIHPYTDLLLHDMGAALNDGYTEGSATTSEWRTTPLWGIGLTNRATGNRGLFLHDGRAHTLDEAIRLHGGEGAQSRQRYGALDATAKQRLLKFLESL